MLQRILTTLGALVVAILAVSLCVDLVSQLDAILTRPVRAADLVPIVGNLSRALGLTLSMIVSLCAIAIPLTSNVYTPKLIEIFVLDRTNRVVGAFYVAANLFVLWHMFVIADLAPETARLRVLVCLALAIVGLLALVPFISYLMRFLVPRSIVANLAEEVHEHLHAACVAGGDEDEIADARHEAFENLKYLGNIALRSVDRYDRDTAFEALKALRELFDAYQARKDHLPAPWFRLRETELHGLGPELGREVERKRAAFEVAVLLELSLVLPLAMARLPEIVAFIAALTRRFGVRTVERRDLGSRELVTLFFNTFLRASLQQRSSDAFYKFVYQYRRFAEEALAREPEHACRVAFFLDYYGHQAKRMGMGYLINVVAYDLAALCELAFRDRSSVATSLLDTFIELDRDEAGLIEMPGVVKAQLILAAKLATRGEVEPVRRLEAELAKVPGPRLEEAFAQIVAAHEENYWEIADRRRHLDHVEPEFRPAMDALRTALTGHKEPGISTQRFLRGAAERGPQDARTRRMDPAKVDIARDAAAHRRLGPPPTRRLEGPELAAAEEAARLAAAQADHARREAPTASPPSSPPGEPHPGEGSRDDGSGA